ncbi:Triose-phosphate Transporter family [Novymonas esmeraldas]|uniref:Triose-phosphate Transporter family n=1 Tax=Novymonas esmeraldas TaxID=1808958 RepID=A0AAW0EP16_9TRYP
MVNSSLLFSLLLNITSSIGVIIVNKKLVFMEAHFEFSTVLTIIHFVMTFLGCAFFAYGLRLFTPKRLSVRRVLPISCAFCGYVVFNNLSLLTNSVSVYQVLKILCTPIIVLIERVCYGKREKASTLLSLVPVCLGVGITFYADVDVNWVGTMWATLAITANSLYTIWGKTKQVELGVQPMQLLIYQAPLSAVMLLFVAVPLDGAEKLAAYESTFTTVWTVLLSCVFAFGVNFSFFLFVGKTSPLTMNVVGYLKTSLVFALDYIFVSADMGPQKLLGIFLTLVGLAGYSYSKMEASAPRSHTIHRAPDPKAPHQHHHDGSDEVKVVAV